MQVHAVQNKRATRVGNAEKYTFHSTSYDEEETTLGKMKLKEMRLENIMELSLVSGILDYTCELRQTEELH